MRCAYVPGGTSKELFLYPSHIQCSISFHLDGVAKVPICTHLHACTHTHTHTHVRTYVLTLIRMNIYDTIIKECKATQAT